MGADNNKTSINDKSGNETSEKKKVVRLRLREWFKGISGQALIDVEKNQLDEELPNLFGYHLVQIGSLGESDFLKTSRISHRVLFDITPQDAVEPTRLICRSSHLPLDGNSVDVILLPHVLEFEDDPHDVLREVERVLIGEGHVLLLGFNPLSLWGIWHALLAWRGEPPWSGHFYRAARIRDWLGLLGFDVIKTKHLFFRPPVRTNWIMQKLSFLEKLGDYIWPWLGGSYLIIGKKRLYPLTPTKTEWRIRRRLIASQVREPTSRVQRVSNQNIRVNQDK